MLKKNATPAGLGFSAGAFHSVTVGAIALLALLSMAPLAQAQTAAITWTNTYQTIDGFGASDGSPAGSDVRLNGAQAALLFSPANGGIGLSLLRTAVPNDGSCSSVNSTCANADLANMQMVAPYGVRIWSAPWSPPASMKSNGSTICNTGSGGAGLNSGSFGAYATYLSNYIKSLSSLAGINLYAISVQNEPDYCPSGYDGASWSASDFDTFVKNDLGPTLAANGQSAVRIMMPESSQWASFTGLASTCMTDAACYNFVGINAWHDYDDASSISNPYASLGKGFWETEASAASGYGPSLCGGCWDPSMADGLLWAGIIDNRMALANANAWHYWALVGADDNEGLLDTDGVTTSKRMYVLGNYSKFVRPGWVRIDATHTPENGVTISAYKDPAGGGFAIVATNQNGSAANVTFSLGGFTPGSVTPWVTSASLDLAQQSNLNVSSGQFSATLPAQSVTTFVGAAGTPPAPPTITQIVVN